MMSNKTPVLQWLAFVMFTFLTHWADLDRPFFADDWYFRSLGGFTLPKALANFDPIHIDWFYRPIYVNYALFWNSIAPGHPMIQHWTAAILVGSTAYFLSIAVPCMIRRTWVLNKRSDTPVEDSKITGLIAGTLFVLFTPDDVVGWACCGSTALCGFFASVAVYLWARHAGHAKSWWTIPFVVLSLLCKEDSLILPIFLIFVRKIVLDTLKMMPQFLPSLVGKQRRLALLQAFSLVAVLILYYFMASIAYHHSHHWAFAQNAGVANNWAPLRSFLSRYTFAYFVPNFGISTSWVLVTAILVGLLVRTRKLPGVQAWLIAGVLTSMIFPLASGAHAMSDRFVYLPNLFLMAFWAQIMMLAYLSLRRLSLLGICIFVIGLLPWFYGLTDPVYCAELHFLTVLLGLLVAYLVPKVRTTSLTISLVHLPLMIAAFVSLDTDFLIALTVVLVATLSMAMQHETKVNTLIDCLYLEGAAMSSFAPLVILTGYLLGNLKFKTEMKIERTGRRFDLKS